MSVLRVNFRNFVYHSLLSRKLLFTTQQKNNRIFINASFLIYVFLLLMDIFNILTGILVNYLHLVPS